MRTNGIGGYERPLRYWRNGRHGNQRGHGGMYLPSAEKNKYRLGVSGW